MPRQSTSCSSHFSLLTTTFNTFKTLLLLLRPQRVDLALQVLLLHTLSMPSSPSTTIHVPITDLIPDLLGEAVDNGRLQVIERLGTGAYGIVYKALDTTSPADSPVYYAIKVLYKYPIGSREYAFQAREVKLHKMVRAALSKHSPPLILHFTDAKHIFLVLDFCAGRDLLIAITEKQRFHRNITLLREAFIQILDAVQHCHDKNVFHRDLKPENILCDDQGGIRLADFGLSTQSGICSDVNLGSPFYMSPEAINAEYSKDGYSTRHCDIWALGIILTNMICGRNPWKIAATTDRCFLSFLTDNELNPTTRPSISEIREEILKLDTFFLSETELAHASSSQRAIAQYYGAPTPEGELGSDSEPLCDPSVSRVTSIDPDEVYLYSKPPFDSPRLVESPEPQIPGDSSSATASDASSDSGGPMTPATHPLDPIYIVEVSDLLEDQNIDDSSAFSAPDPAQGPAQGSAKPTQISVGDVAKPAVATASLFKRAIQRIKAMGV
ncbi:kinase-like domain-containing protein [Mycena rosella]|uniref:non-specific serine/threonine protein kinase n=1 Tax=Mycena rosella TaxID=1033263 RepID=A0AAD7CW97_MYCRO|nr:kinase-like domain-containing protein [Mycena rosella]